MIVDSSALTEQVVDDVIESAFNSAGQRCLALRMLLCTRRNIQWIIEDTWDFTTDIDPLIDK